jgi:hypothetical protein
MYIVVDELDDRVDGFGLAGSEGAERGGAWRNVAECGDSERLVAIIATSRRNCAQTTFCLKTDA